MQDEWSAVTWATILTSLLLTCIINETNDATTISAAVPAVHEAHLQHPSCCTADEVLTKPICCHQEATAYCK
jgi:hypothetical protein